jgi:glycosyltransferase involved in cell wall biosynthesis
MIKPKVLIYGMGLWSHARVYWDLINSCSDQFTFNYINWSFDNNNYNFNDLSKAYDVILVDMNSAMEAMDYQFNEDVLKKVLPICHGPQQVADYTFQSKNTRLKKYLDKKNLLEDLNKFKKILCVSPNTIHAIKKQAPQVVNKLIFTSLAVDPNNFPKSTFIRKNVNNLGYLTHFDTTQCQGMNTKRGYLATAVSKFTNLDLINRSDMTFHLMDLIYKDIDIYLMTSIYESGPLGLFEAGICGIPIIASPAGSAPQFLANGGGILTETFDEEEYVSMAINTINFWKNNPEEFTKQSIMIRENTLQRYTWDKVKHQWIDGIKTFIETK